MVTAPPCPAIAPVSAPAPPMANQPLLQARQSPITDLDSSCDRNGRSISMGISRMRLKNGTGRCERPSARLGVYRPTPS